MAHASSNRQNALQSLPLFARLGEIAEEFRAALEVQRTFRNTLAELQTLSARELQDLGLNPSNLRQTAWESAVTEAEQHR